MRRDFVRGLAIEARHSPALWSTPVLVGAGSLSALSRMSAGLGYWPDALAAINVSGVLLAALAAASVHGSAAVRTAGDSATFEPRRSSPDGGCRRRSSPPQFCGSPCPTW